MASYPTVLASLSTSSPVGTTSTNGHAGLHTQVNGEIVAIETTLGLNVQGTATDLVTRLNLNDTKVTAALTQIVTVSFAGSSTAVDRTYVAIPFAVTGISAKAVTISGTTGTGASIQVFVDNTAGNDLLAGTFTSAGTAGSQVLSFTNGTSGVSTLLAGHAFCVSKASCATAYGCTVTFYLSRIAL